MGDRFNGIFRRVDPSEIDKSVGGYRIMEITQEDKEYAIAMYEARQRAMSKSSASENKQLYDSRGNPISFKNRNQASPSSNYGAADRKKLDVSESPRNEKKLISFGSDISIEDFKNILKETKNLLVSE